MDSAKSQKQLEVAPGQQPTAVYVLQSAKASSAYPVVILSRESLISLTEFWQV
jgi:hypothetical protein